MYRTYYSFLADLPRFVCHSWLSIVKASTDNDSVVDWITWNDLLPLLYLAGDNMSQTIRDKLTHRLTCIARQSSLNRQVLDLYHRVCVTGSNV